MEDFPATSQHLMLNEMNTCMGSESVHRTQYKLNLLSEDIFPILSDKGTEVIEEVNYSFILIISFIFENRSIS